MLLSHQRYQLRCRFCTRSYDCTQQRGMILRLNITISTINIIWIQKRAAFREGHDPHITPNYSGKTQPTENNVPVIIMRQPSHGLWWPLFRPTMGNSVPTAYLHSALSVTVRRQVPRLPLGIYNIQYICCPQCEESVQGINKTNSAATPRPVCINRRQ